MYFMTTALIALLARRALASPHHVHQNLHAARGIEIETVVVTVYQTVEWSPPATPTPLPAAFFEGHSTTSSRTRKHRTRTSSSVSVSPTPSPPPAAAVAPPAPVVTPTTLVQVAIAAAKPTTPTPPAPVVVPTPAAPVAVVKPSPAKPSAPPAASSTAPTTSGSSGKRGLAYNDASLVTGFIGSKVSWAYNWASTSSGLTSSLEFVPMLWGLKTQDTWNWPLVAASAIASGSTHLLAFNEPDLHEQANIGVSDAIAGYVKYMNPFGGKVKLGAPAVTNGPAPMGLTYLSSFISGCKSAGCQIDFVPIHWYDSASNVAYFKQYVQDAHTAAEGRPIWITEFGASGSDAEQNAFLQTVIPWLDSQSYVERYAYFMCKDGVLLSSGKSLSTLGSTFASFTS